MKGFTLIEVMIGTALVAMIALLIWQSSAVLLSTKDRYQEEDIAVQEAMLALSRMADDFSMAYLLQSDDHLGSTGPGEKHYKIAFIGKDNGDRDEVHFGSLANIRYLKGQHESDQAEISYSLEKPEDNDSNDWNLVKRVQSPPDLEPEKGGNSFVMLEGVKELQLQYYDSQKDDWKRNWDSSEIEFRKQLPRAVQVTLVIPDPVNDELTLSFTTTASLAMSPGPNDF
jgi:general secretion pathway protein J